MNIYKVINQIKNNPRHCEICGCKETLHNIILKWDKGKIMCDDCAFKYYNKEDNQNGENNINES